jgi:hypothetical protein
MTYKLLNSDDRLIPACPVIKNQMSFSEAVQQACKHKEKEPFLLQPHHKTLEWSKQDSCDFTNHSQLQSQSFQGVGD